MTGSLQGSPTGSPVLRAGVDAPCLGPPSTLPSGLPGLTLVTWQEFLETPSLLGGLFQTDKGKGVSYDDEQVNVFFNRASVGEAALGTPSEDGFSWVIFVETYSHLMSVRSLLTERVSLLLLHLLLPKGNASDLWLVAVNPQNEMVGFEIQQTLSCAATAFLNRRKFNVVLNLNRRVQRWCRNVLKTSCKVCGGKLVITNRITEAVSCSWMTKSPFSILCLPVIGVRKLVHKFRRKSDYDTVLYFQEEDLTLCTRSGKLNQFAEPNKVPVDPVFQRSLAKMAPPSWIKKNRQAVTAATQTSDNKEFSDDADNDDYDDVDDKSDNDDDSYNEAWSLQAHHEGAECRDTPSDLWVRGTGSESSLVKGESDRDCSSCACHQGSRPAAFRPSTTSTPVPTPDPACLFVLESPLQYDAQSVVLFHAHFPQSPRGVQPQSRNLHEAAVIVSPWADGVARKPSKASMHLKHRRHTQPRHKSKPTGAEQISELYGGIKVDGNLCHVGHTVASADLSQATETGKEFAPKRRKKGSDKVIESAKSLTCELHPSQACEGRDFEMVVRESDLMFSPNKKSAGVPFKNLKNIDKVKYTPVKRLKNKQSAIRHRWQFSKATELQAVSRANRQTEAQSMEVSDNGISEFDHKRSSKIHDHPKAEKVFAVRWLSSDDRYKSLLSAVAKDTDDCDITDIELEEVTSDADGTARPSTCPIRRDSSAATTASRVRGDAQPASSEAEDDGREHPARATKVLPGVKGAQQLRGALGVRRSEQPVSADRWKSWGLPNDSRRRYLALNSLRRKYKDGPRLSLEADVRMRRSSASRVLPFSEF